MKRRPETAPEKGLDVIPDGLLDCDVSFKYELDHIAIAVNSLEEGRKFYQAIGFGEMQTELVESQKVMTGFLALGNRANIELLEPTSPDSTIRKFLDKRGPGIHHICLRVKGIDQVVADLIAKGVQMIDQEPKLGAHGCRVAFIHPKSTGGVLIELSERMRTHPQEGHRHG